MSRVGKNPVLIPAGVEVTLSASEVSIKGAAGRVAAQSRFRHLCRA